jgi:hypothetical protein
VSFRFDEPELEPTSRKPKPVIGVLSPDVRFRDAVQLVGMAGMGAKPPIL